MMTRALRAEWTKLRSVRSTPLALLATIALTLLISVISANSSYTNVNDGPMTIDRFSFAHQPLSGDGSITARVAAQRDSAPWAKSGIMLKSGTRSGSSSVSLMVTPDHGVRMQLNARTELTGSATAAPRWLRLTRTGRTVTGYESADGAHWRTVGKVTATGLPVRAEAGLFVASPQAMTSKRVTSGVVAGHARATVGSADFDHVALTGGSGQWQQTDVAAPRPSPDKLGGGLHGIWDPAPPGTLRSHAGVLTVTGSGDIGRLGMGGIALPDAPDMVKMGLSGVQIAVIAVTVLGVLSITSEYRTRTIRTTFTASPRRGRVLAAKAVVLAGTVFAAGLFASVVTYVITQPLLREGGFGPPAFPRPSLTDPAVLRSVVGSALFLAVLALFSLGVGAILRRTAVSIVAVLALVVVVPIVASITSVSAETWVGRATPIAGLAIQQTLVQPDTVIGPWSGFAVLCAWAAAALGGAYWLLRRGDA